MPVRPRVAGVCGINEIVNRLRLAAGADGIDALESGEVNRVREGAGVGVGLTACKQAVPPDDGLQSKWCYPLLAEQTMSFDGARFTRVS